MTKKLLTLYLFAFCNTAFSQKTDFWKMVDESTIDTGIFQKLAFPRPSSYRIFRLDISDFKAALANVPSEKLVTVYNSSSVLPFPIPNGTIQKFRIVKAPCMAPGLSEKYPEINSYLGQGVDDPSARLRFDVSPLGISASIVSGEQSTIYIDKLVDSLYRLAYRKDMSDYKRVFECLTDTEQHLSPILNNPDFAENADDGKLRTYRLAMISGAEFSLHFIPPGGLPTLADSIVAVLSAQNSHITRVNQVFERDFGVRLLLVPNNDLLIYFDPLTDPIINPDLPNPGGLQIAINSIIGVNNYDIGHTQSKGVSSGNAGCIGCVCNPISKGFGYTVYTNPSLLEFYVIDYLAHEMGHQFGATHTHTHQSSSEGTLVQVEPGSGITIMSYAGITGPFDVGPHKIDIFHSLNIQQVGNYIKTGGGSGCDIETITGNNPPTADAGPDYIIPTSTPFKLTGIGTDPDPGTVLTYNWEQTDSRAFSLEGSFPSPTNLFGPMFRLYLPTLSPSQTFPSLPYILSGANGFMWEVLPSVGRNMNFRFIVRDNYPGGGNNKSDNMKVTTVAGIGPFLVTSQNTNGIVWTTGSSEAITWSVNGSDGGTVNCAAVNILLSTDGGLSFPIVLASATPNDGFETIIVPTLPTSTNCRIKVESVGNIFFDINNSSLTIIPSGFIFNNPVPATNNCPAQATMQTSLTAVFAGGFSNPVTLTSSGNPAGTSVLFNVNPLLPGSPTTTVTLTGTNTLPFGIYNVQVTGAASGAVSQTKTVSFIINEGSGPVINSQPGSQTACLGNSASFSIATTGATSYQWQKSTDGGSNWNNISGATAATYSIAAVVTTDAGLYRCIAIGSCGNSISSNATLAVNTAPTITTQPQDMTLCVGSNHTFIVAATGTGIRYQWQSASVSCVGSFTNISGATSPTLNVTATVTTAYRCIVSGVCMPDAISNCVLLTVVNPVSLTVQPTNTSVCEGGNASFTVAGTGSGIIYQWQLSIDGGANYTNIPGANAATYTLNNITLLYNSNRYRCLLSNSTCPTPSISNAGILTVNSLPVITSQPANSTICSGGSTSFSILGTGAGLTYQWQLSTDGGINYSNITGATISSYTITAATPGMNGYRYQCVISGTCAPSVTSASAILTIIVPVSVTIQPSGEEICSGSNASFTVAGTSTLPVIYQWQVSTNGGTNWNNINDGGIYSGAATATLAISNTPTSANANHYRCQMFNSICATPIPSASATLTVRQLPTIGFTAMSLTSLLPGQVTLLTATPSISTGGTMTVNWLLNGSSISNVGNTRVVNVEQVGTYRVTVREEFSASLACSNQSSDIVISAAVSDKLFIFPSPNDGRFTVSYYNNSSSNTWRRIVIVDSKGSRVYEKEFPITGPYTLLHIDLKSVSRGIYHVLITDGSDTKKIIGKIHIR